MYILDGAKAPKIGWRGEIVYHIESLDALNMIGELRKAPVIKYPHKGAWCYDCVVDGVIYRYKSSEPVNAPSIDDDEYSNYGD